MSYLQLPDGIEVGSNTPIDKRFKVNNLTDTSVLNAPTFFVGLAPIFNISDGQLYSVIGGDATVGWVFRNLGSGGMGADEQNGNCVLEFVQAIDNSWDSIHTANYCTIIWTNKDYISWV